MKVRNALMIALCFAAMPAMAQTTSTGTPSKPATKTPAPSQLESVTPMLPEKADPAKDAAIRHLMDITHTSNLGDNMSGTLSMQVRNAMKQLLPDERLQKFMVDFDQKFRDAMPSSKVTDTVVPIYAKSFSLEEIQELVRFYESPLGQHVVATMGQVSRDSQNAALTMERDAAFKTLTAMTPEYPEIDKVLHPEGSAAPASGQGPKTVPVPAPAPAPAAPQVPTLKPTTPQQ